MALPHLIKHVYNNGSDDTIRRGKKILSLNNIELIEHDDLMGNIVFRVKDDIYNSFYKVYINKYTDAKALNLKCTCPYTPGDFCRHQAGALLRLQDMVDKNLLHSSSIQYNQMHTVAKMKTIDLKMIKMLSSQAVYQEAEDLMKHTKATITKAADERVEAELVINGEKYPLVIQKNDERNFDTSCMCSETLHPLCEHKVLLFVQLLKEHGAEYFNTIKNLDKEKNKLLAIYGYSLEDDLTGKFEFTIKDNRAFMKVVDLSIKRVATVVTTSPAEIPTSKYNYSSSNTFKPTSTFVPIKTEAPKEKIVIPKTNIRLGLVFNFNAKTYPGFVVEAVQGEVDDDNKKYIGKAEKIDLTKFVDTEHLSEEDKLLFQQVRKLQEPEINKYLNRNSPFSGIWENIIQNEGDDLPDETKALIIEYLHPKLKKIFEEQAYNPFLFILPVPKKLKTANMVGTEVSGELLAPVFAVKTNKIGYEVSCNLKIEGKSISFKENEAANSLVFMYEDVLYTWQKTEDVIQAEKFVRDGNINISKADWPEKIKTVILPLTKEYEVSFDKSLIKIVSATTPEIKLMLQERGDYLVFQPVFSYKGFETKATDKETITIPDGDKFLQIERNPEAEKVFLKKLEKLHDGFVQKPETQSLVLKGADVLKNNWFFLFVDAMKEMKIPVFGFEALKNFRFNTAKPTTNIHVSSGQDWFDAKVEIEFGEQKVGISEIKRALADKRSFVQLNDGTLGILPDEWLKKYSLLFKVGDGRTDKLRLSKYHMSIIDDLYENRNEEELSFALDEKYERLKEYKNIPETAAPAQLEPILRPYQLAGYRWLNYLNDVGWGGILADDMGLGKTVQALSMLDHYRAENDGLIAIVICPTTLIFNWQNEIKKFTPELTAQVHHGSTRSRKIEELTSKNIIITTYGTLRSDIQLLLKIKFDYVVLDESQAIKNPSSKVTKAASLLNAINKICMSGTPLQNNTFDIFAQMNFLNPGLLGTMEFFRNEFATPIDKFGDAEPKEHLRKLLYPFILRRTKEQVAKDLPEKTEQILFCEMEKEQRKIYDAYRNSYRDKILGTIDEQGIGKSQLTILQGLMKLRQICDSPAILNEEDKFPNHSVKLDELTREITENIGDHKALIFSQFLGMLALIKQKLIENNIPFEYFDGSTSAIDREKAIQNFQNNDECRVFLISLKAGGVGLNLTAADYVYIVDPWWNPAVEQQAIDRTHRIGQTKNIFAYRMICIDTIEDKILQLQERKKILAKELIADDANFVKALSKQDVEYLFS